MLLNYDEINEWGPFFTSSLSRIVSDSIRNELQNHKFEYIDDALDLLFLRVEKKELVILTLDLIRNNDIKAFHGSRLTEEEINNIKINGLIPLKSERRRARLECVLSSHPQWEEKSQLLESALSLYGRREKLGARENQVHLTLSRSGLVEDFNHYILYGAEFDQKVAYRLFENEGMILLGKYGKPTVITVSVPGEEAIAAANPFYNYAEFMDGENTPNLVKEFLLAWSYWLTDNNFQSYELKMDCGMVFERTVPSQWILEYENPNIEGVD